MITYRHVLTCTHGRFQPPSLPAFLGRAAVLLSPVLLLQCQPGQVSRFSTFCIPVGTISLPQEPLSSCPLLRPSDSQDSSKGSLLLGFALPAPRAIVHAVFLHVYNRMSQAWWSLAVIPSGGRRIWSSKLPLSYRVSARPEEAT